LDDITESREFIMAREEINVGEFQIRPGTIAGQRWRWIGHAAGRQPIVKETYWITAFGLGEGWPRQGDFSSQAQWEVVVEGTPSLRCRFDYRHSFDDLTRTNEYSEGALTTAMIAVNSLPAVNAARPGVVNSSDLKLAHGYGIWKE
jgi:hypothetical protein